MTELIGGTISTNTAPNGNGGGVYVTSAGTVNLKGSTVTGNHAVKGGGGGIYSSGVVNTYAGRIVSNIAKNGGGVYTTNKFVAHDDSNYGDSIVIYDNHANRVSDDGGVGGGIYGNGEVRISKGVIKYNTSYDGGGVYINNGQNAQFVLTNGIIYANTASHNGGGVLSKGVTQFNSGTISNNKATNGDGGGIYSSGVTELIGGTISTNTAPNGNGGGVYVSSAGTVNLKGTQVTGNHAVKGAGGGICSSGDVNTYAGRILSNLAKNGGGVYTTSKFIAHDADAYGDSIVIANNQANRVNNEGGAGGGIYGTGEVRINKGVIKHNTSYSGGGVFLYGENAQSVMSNGIIYANTADNNGGGIYIGNGATLNLRGTSKISSNHVPAGGKGGGIYQNGTLNVGGGTDPYVKAFDNYAGTSYSAETQNNVYLPSADKLVTVVSDISHKTNDDYDTHIGISVNQGDRPVVQVLNESNEGWLNNLLVGIHEGGGAVFDDAQHYVVIHTRRNVDVFNKKFIYFWTSWSTEVASNPGNNHIQLVDGVYHIKTSRGLAWFGSLVNGLNGNSSTANRSLSAALDNDIDMSEHLWVPIGAVTSYNNASSSYNENENVSYTGNFNGQGHIITGLRNGFLEGIGRFGLFGSVGGNGTVKNTFLDNYVSTTSDDSHDYTIGGISGEITDDAVISCSEARGEIDAAECGTSTMIGGLVGNMGGSSAVHSSMAMPEILGNNTTMGGLVGKLTNSATVKSCFSNGKYTGDNSSIGGLVGNNSGTVENCYVRLRGEEPDDFGWFAGSGNGSVKYCYAPADEDNYGTGTLTGTGNYGPTKLVNGKYGFKHQDQQITLVTEGSNSYVVNGVMGFDGELTGLLATLNKWVDAQPSSMGYARWTRTMGSAINGDYPVPQFDVKNNTENFCCLGSPATDNVFLNYNSNFNPMISAYNGIENGGSIYVYSTPELVTESNDDDVKVYIGMNVCILEADPSKDRLGNRLTATVGVVLDNTSTGYMAYDWHMFSSALEAAPIGLKYPYIDFGNPSYNTNYDPEDYTGYTYVPNSYPEASSYYVADNFLSGDGYLTNGIPQAVYRDATKMEAPKPEWDTRDGKIGYFPTDAPYGTWRGVPDTQGSYDFYCFDEKRYHWINLKRNCFYYTEGTMKEQGDVTVYPDHWQENSDDDGNHANIDYRNETEMVRGKGYLVAMSEASYLMANGVLNNGTINRAVTSQAPDDYFKGTNLVGNPYMAYLDFDLFAENETNAAAGVNTYYVLDADAKGYLAYTKGQTAQPELIPAEEDWPNDVKGFTAGQYIHSHQGFLVKVTNPEAHELQFTNTMRKTNVDAPFRGGVRYPLINLVCTDGEGMNEFATVELSRPETGGGRKIKGLHTGDASLWIRLKDNEDYHTAFAPEGTREVPVHFKAYDDDVFTLRWNMQNADFSYVHLVDNLTGTDTDCLATNQYVFEGNVGDYTSRFRLVFDYLGIEEYEEPGTGGESNVPFAFQMEDELVVNGEGILQVIDMLGRVIISADATSRISTSGLSDGVYLLRLINGKDVKTQKMVVKKWN